MTAVELEIPPRSAYVGVVRLTLASLARTSGLDEDAVEELKMAVSEACANAVLANEEAGSEEPVTVEYRSNAETLTVLVQDRGGDSADPVAHDLFDSQGFSSRVAMSLRLLNSLVDECDFIPRDGGGMTTQLVVKR
ncbi:MAG: ATP-binding protein [Actinomycetota bacterium]|nr:ATP-binding protein [Actinomycetota bacterium]